MKGTDYSRSDYKSHIFNFTSLSLKTDQADSIKLIENLLLNNDNFELGKWPWMECSCHFTLKNDIDTS